MTLKPDYDLLPQISLICGVLTFAPALFALAAPGAAQRVFKRFPRSVWPGRVLSAVCLAWSALWLIAEPFFPFLVAARDLMWLLIPLSVAAVWIFLPELLSCRAFGGLIALAPSPMLSAARWHPSAWRYVVVAYAYALAVAGMFYIASPYLMRDHITAAFASPRRARAAAAAFATLGAALIALSAVF